MFDLKTGQKDVLEFGQLHIYAALFCLEYGYNPLDLTYEFRLYQNDEVRIDGDPNPETINDICEQIKHFDRMVIEMKHEARENRSIL